MNSLHDSAAPLGRFDVSQGSVTRLFRRAGFVPMGPADQIAIRSEIGAGTAQMPTRATAPMTGLMERDHASPTPRGRVTGAKAPLSHIPTSVIRA